MEAVDAIQWLGHTVEDMCLAHAGDYWYRSRTEIEGGAAGTAARTIEPSAVNWDREMAV
jgi:hypothetical protein